MLIADCNPLCSQISANPIAADSESLSTTTQSDLRLLLRRATRHTPCAATRALSPFVPFDTSLPHFAQYCAQQSILRTLESRAGVVHDAVLPGRNDQASEKMRDQIERQFPNLPERSFPTRPDAMHESHHSFTASTTRSRAMRNCFRFWERNAGYKASMTRQQASHEREECGTSRGEQRRRVGGTSKHR